HSHSNPVQPMTPRGVRTMDAAARKLRVANFKFRDIDFFLICQAEWKRAHISEPAPHHSKSCTRID
ncbi:hypothetical protein, partial [Burkholderia vietnamiensis]|uniref:hypothetical protein n=1 Tax=Burkholderia vietnamiensis TaxID=60552 RepID=UPI001CF5E9D6